MALTQNQIDRIIDLQRRLRIGTEAIAKQLGHSKNTVKKYLRRYGLLNYTYSPYQGGSPSLVSPSQTGSYTPQQEINDPMQRGGRLVKKLDETFVSLDTANEQIQTLTSELNTVTEQSNTQITQLKNDLEKAAEREQNLTTENKKLTDITTQQVTEIESVKLEKDSLQTTVNKQQAEKVKMEQDHQRDFNTLKKSFEKYVIKLAGDHQRELDKQRNKSIETLKNQRKEDAQKLETQHSIYEEQAKSIKNEIQNLNDEINISFWKGVAIGAAGGGIVGALGTLGYQKYISPRSNVPRPMIVDSRKTTTGTPILPVLQAIRRQPDIHYTNSKVTPEITPSLTLCSGAIFNHNRENTSIGYNTAPSPQEDMFQHDIQGNDRSVNPVTNISGILSQGAFSPGYSVFPNQSDVIQPNTHNEVTTGTDTPSDQCSDSNNPQKNACIGSTFIPNQTDTVMPSDTNNDVTFVTRVSGDQSLGIYCSSHFEIEFTPQDATPVQVPSSFQIPLNYIPYIPFPTYYNDISEIYPMKQLRRLKGIAFEIYTEKLFIHRGCPTERTPYGDYSGDMIVTLNGVPTVIECKQKPIVRVDTIQRTFAAKEHYRNKGVTHCLVINTGQFTQDARDEAQRLGVELWDGKRLLEEIYKDQFFYLPENPEDYDPDK